MVFLNFMNIAGFAIVQIFILGLIGFFVIRLKLVSEEGLNAISTLVINVILPLFIFTHLVEGFNVERITFWWLYPVIALILSTFGFVVGFVISKIANKASMQREIISLVTFQNAGYLPLVLVGMILTGSQLDDMIVIIALSLIGFNLVIWSVGIIILTHKRLDSFEWQHLFSAPVVASILALIVVFLNFNSLIPFAVFKPLKALGDCTLPLAILVVGGNLASMKLRHVDAASLVYAVIAKVIILPSLALVFILNVNMPYLMKMLILIQACMPSAVSLSVIARHYNLKEQIVSQGIFFSHLLSLVTIPIFLSLFLTIVD